MLFDCRGQSSPRTTAARAALLTLQLLFASCMLVTSRPASADLRQWPMRIEFSAGTVQQWVEFSNVSDSAVEVAFRVHEWHQTPTQEFLIGPESGAVTVVPPSAFLQKGESIKVRLVLRNRDPGSYRFISEVLSKSEPQKGRITTLFTTGSPIFVGMQRFSPELTARMVESPDGLRLEMTNRGSAPAKLVRIDDGQQRYEAMRYILPRSIQVMQLSGLTSAPKVLRFENGESIRVSLQ